MNIKEKVMYYIFSQSIFNFDLIIIHRAGQIILNCTEPLKSVLN